MHRRYHVASELYLQYLFILENIRYLNTLDIYLSVTVYGDSKYPFRTECFCATEDAISALKNLQPK